jgi:inner membrane protein
MSAKLRTSLFLKVVVIAVLVMVLAIPLLLERGLVEERRNRREDVAVEVAASWGGPQVVGGPVLAVPFRGDRAADGSWVRPPAVYDFLPEELVVVGELVPEVRRRGIFDWVVYRAELRISGSYAPLDVAGWAVARDELDWSGATLRLGVADVHGLRGAGLAWDGQEVPWAPGGRVEGLWSGGVQALIGQAASGEPAAAGGDRGHAFEITLSLLGSEVFEVLPLGGTSRVRLTSSWPDPSFLGGFLPEARRVAADGFEAAWTVPDLAQGRPRRWRDGELGDGDVVRLRRPGGRPEMEQPAMGVGGFASLGVALYRPVGHYQRTERSIKYAFLFILLTFVTLFLHELAGRAVLHPMHYLLVGAALVLFYLLLLSLSEHVGFTVAYLIAAAAVVAQVTAYGAAVLRQRRGALTLGLVTAILYAYFWVLLDAEDHALLIGSAGLFAVLALVMYLTRRVDWSAPAGAVLARLPREPGSDAGTPDREDAQPARGPGPPG